MDNDPKIGTEITTAELQLADKVRLAHMKDDKAKGPYLVRQIDKVNGKVHLWRPYIHHADFSHTGGVIPYVGIEDFPLELTYSGKFLLIERTDLK
jgi:hypothetical protein